MKHLYQRSCYVVLFVCFLLVACTPKVQEIKPESTSIGLLWTISKPGFSDSFLFGTIHSDDERITNLSTEVQHAFNSSPAFALELILDEAATKSVMAHMYFSDGNTLQNVIGDDLFKRSVEALSKKGMSSKAVNRMKPWAVFTLLNMPDNQSGTFLDAMLYDKALKTNKKVVGLETPMEQVSVFNGLDYDIQTQLLEKTLDQYTDMQKVMDEIIGIYLTRDLEEILQINEKYNRLMGKELATIFNKRLLTDRNVRMAERMLPLLEEGQVFIGVGALHLPGEDGLITLLKQQGFVLESVY